MPRIIGVHGVGHQFSGENMLLQQWLPALRDGLKRSDGPTIQGDDLACAFYGDLFRSNAKGAPIPDFIADDLNPDEQMLLQLWWEQAANTDQMVRAPSEATKVGVPLSIQRGLNALMQSSFFAGIAERALIFDLKQVYRYLHDSEIRSAARKRIEDRIDSETRVIIAHSLGSVIAYESLCANPDWPVTDLITLGSPLGIRHLIFDKLEPNPQQGIGAWPAGLRRWVNISDVRDVVALNKKLNPVFAPSVSDVSVNNGAKSHDATRYLTTREVGHAVAIAL
jgi:hypothetical protein